jgi:REP element-mobilizing transposase RayT
MIGTIMARQKHREPLHPESIIDPGSLPYAPERWRGNLPHIYKEGCSYFVTFCLFDAVKKRQQLKEPTASSDAAENVAARSDLRSDAGCCLLKTSEVASIVEDALLHFQGQRYSLSAWCVMPNHVHVVVTPYPGHVLPDILHSWKSFTAHRINSVLGREGRLWEEEFFDHLVRNERDFEKFVRYTEENPVAAGLCELPEDWPFSSSRYRERRTRDCAGGTPECWQGGDALVIQF